MSGYPLTGTPEGWNIAAQGRNEVPDIGGAVTSVWLLACPLFAQSRRPARDSRLAAGLKG